VAQVATAALLLLCCCRAAAMLQDDTFFALVEYKYKSKVLGDPRVK
jgi:hypothetical protein